MPARRMGHKPVRRGSAPADLMPSRVEGIVIFGRLRGAGVDLFGDNLPGAVSGPTRCGQALIAARHLHILPVFRQA